MALQRDLVYFQIILAAGSAVFALLSQAIIAQPTARTEPPAFEVASVRQNVDPNPEWRMFFTADGLTATATTLHYAIREAYGVYDVQLWSGGPSWIMQRRFDMQAKFDVSRYPNPTLEERRAMLRQLLADRFKVTVHHETRAFPLYALVIAKNGPKIIESKPDEIRRTEIHGVTCTEEHTGKGLMELRGCSMAEFSDHLTSEARAELGRQVFDRTGLVGRYNLILRWTPTGESGSLTSSDPFFFTAINEQLGLELKPIKGPVDTFVIDHAEMPNDN